MSLTERQAFVLDHIHRVSTDGARHEARYELDGTNVSSQVRSLLDRGLAGFDPCGALTQKNAGTPEAQGADPSVLHEMRALLLTETPPPHHKHRAPRRPAETQRGHRRTGDAGLNSNGSSAEQS